MKDFQTRSLISGLLYVSVSQLLFALGYGTKYTAYPLVGSTAGGTLITILFNGSTMDNQHFGNGAHLEVHMTSPQRPPVICDLLLSYTTPIQCKTKAVTHREDSYELQVFYDGQPVIPTSVITYKFSPAETPEIYGVVPSCGAPGGIIELTGRIMTSNYEDYDFNGDFIDGPMIMTSDQDGWKSVCTMADKISKSIYPIHVNGDIGSLRCKTAGSYIGSQNITFSVFNKGKSIVRKDAWSISAKHEVFLYQTFPEIHSVYPDSGSLGGGTDVTIRGDFFMDPVTVTIAGNSCKIKSLTPQVIICTTAPPGQYVKAPYPGNRGLLYEMWIGPRASDTDELSLQQRSVVLSASSPPDVLLDPGQLFRARISGFFVSPETNNYTFWIQSDSKAQLFISQSHEEEAKVEVASIPQGISTWTEHWELDWNLQWKQKSPKMELVQGKKYYIEMLQSGTGPQSSMNIGVQIHNTWLSPEVVTTYQREKHQIVAQSSRIPEIQVLTFDGVGEVQFCWGNTSSKAFYTNSTADQVQAVVEDMLSVHCISDLLSEDVLLYSGFEDERNITNLEGERSSWEEPYCGRCSVFNPKYILKGSNAVQTRYELSRYHYLCFAYKGYLDDYLMVSVTYNDSFLSTVAKNLTCQWKFNKTKAERWNYGCTNLWMCLQDSLEGVQRKSSIYVDQIILMQTENEDQHWYFIDEIIITNKNVTVQRVDPKRALPGGHQLTSTTITGSYPSYNLTALVANCGINLPLIGFCGASTESIGDNHHVQKLRMGEEDISLVVTRLQAASPPIGGTFSVDLSGAIISGIPVHVSPSDLKELLTRHTDDITRPYIDISDFTIAKDVNTCHKIVLTLTWKNLTGDLPNFLQVFAENLTGLEPSIITRVLYDGGVLIWPIFGDMLASSNPRPQVILNVNIIPAQCSGSCSFQHLLNATPVVSDIQYTAGVSCDFIVNILGSGFHGSSLELDIMINQIYCRITEANTSSIICCIEAPLPLGEHQVYVHVKNQGFAINGNGSKVLLHVAPKLSAVIPSVIPETGGHLVTLTGVRLDGATAVAFGSHLCPVLTSNSTTIRCEAPPLHDNVSRKNVRINIERRWITFSACILYDSFLNPLITSISPNTSSAAGDQVVFINLSSFNKVFHAKMEMKLDMATVQKVNVKSDGIEVTLPPRPPGIYNVSVIMNGISLAANGFQPVIRYVLEMYSLEPCCGSFLDCIEDKTFHISGAGFSPGNTSVTICGSPCELSGNLTTPNDLYCSNWKLNSSWTFLCDWMFETGAQCHEKRSTFIHCDVTVRVGALLVTSSLAYLHVCHCNGEYDARPVPADNGTTHVTHITGLFISPKVEEDEVLIYNGFCSISIETEAEMECKALNQPITTQITAIRKSWLQNTQVSNFSAHFCGLWSRNSTWPSGHLPLDGDNVTVERGWTLLLDDRTHLLHQLHIKGGKIIFIGSGFVHLRAHYILISDGGELQVGTKSQPFKGSANITLYGSSYSAPFHPYGVKFLSVRNASISIHGWVPKFISTNLASPARANDTQLTVMDPVDWRIGDQFVLCGSSFYDPIKQEEVLTIVKVNGTCISVSPPLRYAYDILDQPLEVGYVSLRPIVALVSRDITIQGNLTDEYTTRSMRCQEAGVSEITDCPYDRSEKTLGSQDLGMMFIAQALKDETSLVQISGVRFLHAGQGFAQSRSALSIAGNGPMFGSYIQGCVVVNSFARGLSLSGISHFTVEENIFYNIKGHGVIIGEHLGNYLQVKRNLLIKILGSDSLSNIETLAPAAVYIMSPSNTIEENVVCSSGYGYFYHLAPDGPSQAPFETFRKNSVVSCMRSGFRLHPDYQPSGADSVTAFQDFTAWKSRGGAEITKCGNVSFKDFQIFSCKEFGINIGESSGKAEVSDSLLLGHFDGEEGKCMTSGIATPKRFQVVITNTTFRNFDREECNAIKTCSGCIMGQGGFTVKTQKLKFLKSPRKVFFSYPHCALIKDIDGSVSGSEGSHLLANTGILPDSSCWAVDYISGDGVTGRVCSSNITFHRMSIALERAPSVCYNITLQNSSNQTSNVNYVPDTLSNLYGWQALLLDKETYTIIYHVPHRKTSLQYSATFDDFAAGNYLYIRHINLPSVLNISIICGSAGGKLLQSIPPLPTDGAACDWSFDSERGILVYLVKGEGQVRVKLVAEETSIQPTLAPSPPPHPILRWSSPESWAGVSEGWGGHGSTTPQAGDDVIILPNRTIVVDVVLPPLRGLYIVGALEFPPDLSNELSVACILIAGGRLSVGTSREPLQRERRIRILLLTSTRVHCDRLNGLHVSPGVIGVYGKLQLYSAYPSKSWTRLGADIAPGNEMIALNNTVDWSPGDKIVISSSSYEAHQAELVYLRDIYGPIVRIWGKLNYWHSGTIHMIGDTLRILLTAEVGLLSRNIQIDTDTPCSGSIMVGQHTSDLGEKYLGSLELSNVEISNFGTSSFPSINFINTSQSSSISSSSIHHSCGGGIRSTNSTNIMLHANVLYNSVGHGVHLDGGSHVVTDNLVVLMQQPKTQVEWVTGMKINPPSEVFLSGNSVAGSERIAYHLPGKECHFEEKLWQENVAHSNLHGIHVYWEDDLRNCTKISGFLSYKNYDYGLFFHVEGSAVVDEVTLVDNRVGLLPIVSQHSAFSSLKQYIAIHNSIIVATSSAFDCLRDRIEPSSANVTQKDRAPSSPYSGRVGMFWPMFTKKPRLWPDYPWHMLAAEETVSGIMTLQDVTFSGFKKSCYSDDFDTCIMSIPGNMAITCPITAERIKMPDIRSDHIFYFYPQDRTTSCPLSAECSGAQAALFKDLDGSFLGRGPTVTVFPISELVVVHSCYNIGIYKKDDLCSYQSEWQAHMCQQIDHTVVILEVISDVQEPVSPVISVTNNFIQVFVSGQNAPDRCCEKNNKTFYSILPAQKISKVCFNGPTPNAIRLRLNGCQNSTKLILALFYDFPLSCYIVWKGKKYSTIFSDFQPNFQSGDQISSFFSFRENLLYVLLQGDEPVEIWTNLSIHLFFYMALGTTSNDLYNQLPLKMATFLEIDPSRVAIVQNLQESAETLKAMMDNHSKRKRHCPPVHEERPRAKRHSESLVKVENARYRQESLIEVLVVEIRDIVTPGEPAATLTYGNLQNIATSIIGALQTGELEKAIPINIDSLMVVEPTHRNNSRYNSSTGSRSAVYARPHGIHVAVQPVGGTAGAPLPVQPKVVFLDKKGNRIVNLGHFSDPWKVSVYLKDASGAPLKGRTTAVIEDGWGNFSNLAVSSSGSNWCLIFNVISPAGVGLSVESKEFQVSIPLNRNKENIFMLVILSSAASAIILFLFLCFFCKKKNVERLKEKTRKTPRR
ncbi:fibrocystin isoform X3 [Phyllobates terribilis]|uniref:fibrocystin isoform X3 n=1 Tax=Phyllobates terribilis TaxID=111132 RepID=UPI003CCAB9A9